MHPERPDPTVDQTVGVAPAAAIRVVLADDHLLVREGLRRLLGARPGIEVVAEAGDGPALLEILAHTVVDVAVVDLSMPGISGIELIERITARFPDVPVLVLTMHAEAAYAQRALRAGASGYVTKGADGAELITAIGELARGGGYVNRELAQALAIGLRRDAAASPRAWLSPREMQVLRRLARGDRLVDIADALKLSVKTVSTHKTRIQEKLHVHGTAGLTRYALAHGLVDDDAR